MELPSTDVLLDTSGWVAITNAEPAAPEVLGVIGGSRLVTSPLVLAEMAAMAAMGRLSALDAVTAIETQARLEELTREDALFAAEVYARVRPKPRSKLGLADALIYATARRVGALYVTLDADLASEPGVRVIARTKRRT